MYEQAFSRADPGCIVFLVDRSDSMQEQWAGSGMNLAQGAARAINKVLLELCVKSTKEAGGALRAYFYVGIFGYGLCPSTGEEGVESALPGPLAARGIVPLPELAQQPIAVREEPSIDAMAVQSKVPVWIEARHGFRTPMCQAIATAGAYVNDWANAFPRSFPPIVINLTDGFVTDSPYEGADLELWGKRLTSIETSDGQALLLNIFLSADPAPGVWFPATDAGLPEPGPSLFSISSPMPQRMVDNARSAHLTVPPGARGLVFNADLTMLVKFLEIGTRLAAVQDR
jgi:hypothetical protein